MGVGRGEKTDCISFSVGRRHRPSMFLLDGISYETPLRAMVSRPKRDWQIAKKKTNSRCAGSPALLCVGSVGAVPHQAVQLARERFRRSEELSLCELPLPPLCEGSIVFRSFCRSFCMSMPPEARVNGDAISPYDLCPVDDQPLPSHQSCLRPVVPSPNPTQWCARKYFANVPPRKRVRIAAETETAVTERRRRSGSGRNGASSPVHNRHGADITRTNSRLWSVFRPEFACPPPTACTPPAQPMQFVVH